MASVKNMELFWGILFSCYLPTFPSFSVAFSSFSKIHQRVWGSLQNSAKIEFHVL